MTSDATIEKLRRAREIIDRRYCEPLDVPTLAGTVGLSRAHFIREFHHAFGQSPHQYMVGLRMERAAALLRTTDRVVADICRAIGWRSVGSFTTRFTRTHGVSPAAYRSAHARTTRQAAGRRGVNGARPAQDAPGLPVRTARVARSDVDN